ncbi:MAG: hypothetical protein ACQES1_09115 [Bacteroidota bacterium]
MKKLSSLLIAMLLAGGFVHAQQSEQVEIMDMVVTPAIQIDSVTGQPIETDNETLEILFKVNHPENANTIHVLFGTAQDAGDVLSLQGNIVQEDDVYYTSLNGQQEAINGYTAKLHVTLTPQQKEAYNVISLYIEDNENQQTETLYFVK